MLMSTVVCSVYWTMRAELLKYKDKERIVRMLLAAFASENLPLDITVEDQLGRELVRPVLSKGETK